MAIRKPICILPLPFASIAGSTYIPNRPWTHLGHPEYVGMRWEADGGEAIWLRGEFDEASPVDFCSLMACNAQAGTTIRLRLGSTADEVDGGSAAYDSGALTLIDPARTREDGLYHSHLELDAVETATWWRIDIGNHTGDFSASCLILGQKREPSHFYNRDREIGSEDLGELEFSRNGVPADTPGAVLRTLLFRLQWVSDEEYWSTWEPLGRRNADGSKKIMLWVFDPESHARRQDKTFLGYLARDPFKRGNDFPKDNQMDFQLRAVM